MTSSLTKLSEPILTEVLVILVILARSQPTIISFGFNKKEFIIYSSVKAFLNPPYLGQSFNQYHLWSCWYQRFLTQCYITIMLSIYRCFFKFFQMLQGKCFCPFQFMLPVPMSVILCLTAQFFITFKAPIQDIVDFTMPSFLAFIAPNCRLV